MEWDWWSRMQGPSSQHVKGPTRGKWWANLRNPAWQQPNPRCHRRQPQSFGVLPGVDLDSVHVKTLDEILREKEARKRREQATTLACASRSIQETTRGDLRMVHCQDQSPIHRIRLSQYNFHRGDRDEEEDDEEIDSVAMETAISDDEEDEETSSFPEELSVDEPEEETTAGSLEEEGRARDAAEEQMNHSGERDEDFLPVDGEDDQSCQEKALEEIDDLDFSQDDSDLENSVDEDVSSLEEECEIAQVEAELINSDQEVMDADDIQEDGRRHQNCKEQKGIDIKDVDSSLDELFAGELEIDIDEEAECESLRAECKVSGDQQGTTHSELAITQKQGNLLADPVGDGNFFEEDKGTLELEPSENAPCLREPHSDVGQATEDGSQDKKCTIPEVDEDIGSKQLEFKDEDEELLLQNDLVVDEGCNESLQERDVDVESSSPPDEPHPEESDGSTDEETSCMLQEKEESRTYQSERETVCEEIDRDEDAKAVEQMSLQGDASRSCQEKVIRNTWNVDISQEELHPQEPNEDLRVDDRANQRCHSQDLEGNLQVITKVDNCQQIDSLGESLKMDAQEEKEETEDEKGRMLEKSLVENCQDGSEGVLAEDSPNSTKTDGGGKVEVKDGREDDRLKKTKDDKPPDASAQYVLDSSEQSQDASGAEKTSNKQSLDKSPVTSFTVEKFRTESYEALPTLGQESGITSSTTVSAPAENEETRNAAIAGKLKEYLPRALQDEEVITPEEDLNPVKGNDDDVVRVDEHQIKITTRPYTRKRKLEEMMEGRVVFHEARHIARGRTEAPRKARQKRTDGGQIINDIMGLGAVVKDKLDKEEVSVMDNPEVPLTREQSKETAESQGRGRHCLRSKDRREGDSPKSGLTRQTRPDAEVTSSQRRKSKSKKREEKCSLKEEQRGLVKSDAVDAPCQPRQSRQKEKEDGGSQKPGQAKEAKPVSGVVSRPVRIKRPVWRLEDDSAEQRETRKAGNNSLVSPSHSGRSRHKERGRDSMTTEQKEQAGSVRSKRSKKSQDPEMQRRAEQIESDVAITSPQLSKSVSEERKVDVDLEKGQTGDVRPEGEVASSQPRKGRPKERRKDITEKRGGAERVRPKPEVTPREPMGQMEEDSAEQGGARHTRPADLVVPSRTRKRRCKKRGKEDSGSKGQTKDVGSEEEVAPSPLGESRSEEKEEDVSMETEEFRPAAEVAPSPITKCRSKARDNKNSSTQEQIDQAEGVEPDSKVAPNQQRKTRRSIKTGQAKEAWLGMEVTPEERDKDVAIEIEQTKQSIAEEAPSQIRSRSRKRKVSKIDRQVQQAQPDAEVDPNQPRKSRLKEVGKKDSIQTGQAKEARLGTEVAQNQPRENKAEEGDGDVAMEMEQAKQSITEAAPSGIRSRTKKRKKDSKMDKQVEQAQPDVKEILDQEKDKREPKKRPKWLRSKVDLEADGRQVESNVACSELTQKDGANEVQFQSGKKTVEEKGDNIRRRTRKLRGSCCEEADTLQTGFSAFTSREATETDCPSTETEIAQILEKKAQQSTESSWTSPSEMVAEAADIDQSCHRANRLGKGKLESSAHDAKDGKPTESDAGESPCQEGTHVKRGSSKRRRLRKDTVISKFTPVVQKRRGKRKRGGDGDQLPPGCKDGGSTLKKQKGVLEIKTPSPTSKQAVVATIVSDGSSMKDSADEVNATADSKKVIQDRRVNQGQGERDADMHHYKRPNLDTSPELVQNPEQDDGIYQEVDKENAEQILSQALGVSFLEATPESDQNLAQDANVSQYLEDAIAALPFLETRRVSYLDATPDSDQNLSQDIQVIQEPEAKEVRLPFPDTSRVLTLDATSDSDQNAVQHPSICQEAGRKKAYRTIYGTLRIPYIEPPDSDQDPEPEAETVNLTIFEIDKDPDLDATLESDQVAAKENRIDETKGKNAHQSLSKTLGIPFSQILANQPRVLLQRLSFKVSIPLDGITLKTQHKRRRGRPRKMKSIAKKAQEMTRGLEGIEETWNQLGFRKPSQLIQPSSEASSDDSYSAATHSWSVSPGGGSIPRQENRSAFPDAHSDPDSLNKPPRNASDVENFECSGDIVEAPEVAHTVEVVSTNRISPATTNAPVDFSGSTQDTTVLSVLPTSDLSSVERLTYESENFIFDQESCQLCSPDNKSFDYELDSQVQILNSEYEAMGLSSSDDCPNLCFTSPPMKVMVTTLPPAGCMDVPPVSLTNSSQSNTDRVPGYPHTLPPMQIFLRKMMNSAQMSTTLQTFAQDLGGSLLPEEEVGASQDVTNPLDSVNEEQRKKSPRQDLSSAEATADDVSETRVSTPNANSEIEEEAGVSHQERAPQSPKQHLNGEDCKTVGGSRVDDPKSTVTDAEQIQALTVAMVTSPASQDVSEGNLTPAPQPGLVLSTSPVLDALLSTIVDTSFNVAGPQDAPSTMSEGRDETFPESSCNNLAVPVAQKPANSVETSQNGASSAVPTSSTAVTPPARSQENDAPDSRSTSSQFGDLTLPPLGEDFEFPEEDCISLVCDTDSFLDDFSHELMEIDKKIGDTETRPKSGPSSKLGNQPLGTGDTNDQLRKIGPSRKETATSRLQPPLQTVDWSEVEYQPIRSRLAGGDCSTNDRRRVVGRDQGHSSGTQEACQSTSLGRNWTTPTSHYQGLGNQPGFRNQVIPRGYCYDFVRTGRCLRRACPYIHSEPTDSQTQCVPPPSRLVFKGPENQRENSTDLLAVVNECNVVLGAHLRGRDHAPTEQGFEDREASSLDSEGTASPAAIFEAAYRLQQCSSWRQTRETLIDICQCRPEVATCQPVVQELMGKLRGSPKVLGEKFGNFVAIFRRPLAENASDPATDSLKQALSHLGVSTAMQCCTNTQWGQARFILNCLYNQNFPCPEELTQNVLLIQQRLAKHQPQNLQESGLPPCGKGT